MNLERANWTLEKSRDWHVAWYLQCLDMIDKFTNTSPHNSPGRQRFGKRTNLCHYVRVTALWGPLIILAHVTTLSLIMGAGIFLPLQFFGISGLFTMWTTISLGGFFIASICWAAIAFEKDKPVAAWVKLQGRRVRSSLSFTNPEGVSFWSVVWDGLVAAKEQICPLIEIKEDK